MENFKYYAPTKVYFGKDEEKKGWKDFKGISSDKSADSLWRSKCH